jgi:hypothetical protein
VATAPSAADMKGGASSDIGGKASARAATTTKHPSKESDSGKASANDDNTIKQAGQTKVKMSKKRRQAPGGKTGTAGIDENTGQRALTKAVGDMLQQCSNKAFKKGIDIRRRQQCW